MRHSFIIFALAISSCANVPAVQNQARKASDVANCSSFVEATLVSDTLYSSKPPLLILKKAYNTARALRGALLSLTDSGVVFLRVKDGLYTPEPQFYAIEEIECLVDSNNRVRIGEWKGSSVAFWNIELLCQRTDSADTKPLTLILEPNKSVSYCVAAGEYKVVNMRFRGFDDYVDQSNSLCCTRFTVKPNAITRIGTFKLEYTWKPSPDLAIVPTSVLHRPGMNESPLFLGGAIGGALQHLADKERAEKEMAASPFHALGVTIDSAFTQGSKGGLPLNFSPLNLDEFKSAREPDEERLNGR